MYYKRHHRPPPPGGVGENFLRGWRQKSLRSVRPSSLNLPRDVHEPRLAPSSCAPHPPPSHGPARACATPLLPATLLQPQTCCGCYSLHMHAWGCTLGGLSHLVSSSSMVMIAQDSFRTRHLRPVAHGCTPIRRSRGCLLGEGQLRTNFETKVEFFILLPVHLQGQLHHKPFRRALCSNPVSNLLISCRFVAHAGLPCCPL